MLIRFVTSNFLSFNEEKEFNMLAGSFRTHKHHVYKAGKLNVLKGAALYGANGAGKSNLVKAIDYLQKMVENGGVEKSINSQKFKLDKTKVNEPAEFEIEFYFKGKIYAYGVSVNDNIIEKEWLYISGIDKEDKLVFERKTLESGKPNVKLGKSNTKRSTSNIKLTKPNIRFRFGRPSIRFGQSYIKTKKDELLVELMEDNLLLSNELLLGKTDNLKMIDVENVREWIEDYLMIIYPETKLSILLPGIALSANFTGRTNYLSDWISKFDTGVDELGWESIDFETYFNNDDEKYVNDTIDTIQKEGHVFILTDKENVIAFEEDGRYVVKKIISIHQDENGNKVNFDLSEESDGTQRLLDFIPAVDGILNNGITYVIDEIDQSLHPELLQTLVKKIMDEPNTKGQLIFTTHESNLLDLNIFRQDEIWFAEKDKGGSTNLYSLSEYKPRYDLDIRKGYLKGRFGAIPFMGDLEKLNWSKNDA